MSPTKATSLLAVAACCTLGPRASADGLALAPASGREPSAGLGLTGLHGFEQALPNARPETSPQLRLAWIDPTGIAGRSGPGARAEAARIFGAMGVHLTWRRSTAGAAARGDEIRVILLDRAAGDGGRSVVLGATPDHFEDARFVWIHVPSVRGSLGLAGRDPAALDLPDDCRVGLALGRVIAHELVHALAPALPHGNGLMAARLTRRDLAGPSVPVTAEVTSAVRTAIAGVPVERAQRPGLLSLVHAAGEPQVGP